MNVTKSMKLCMRLLRQRSLIRTPQSIQAISVRNYRADDDDASGWSADQGNSRSFDQSELSRRNCAQAIEDHRRRQERIIMDNKRRWERRNVPKKPIIHDYTVYADKGKGRQRQNKEDRVDRRDGRDAEKYSRRRRQQRQREVKRYERELRESRKGYKLPRSEMHEEPQEEPEETPTTKAVESPWHTWNTCPDQRRSKDNDNDSTTTTTGYTAMKPTGKPKLPHDGSVRRFQTHSQQLAIAPPSPPPACRQCNSSSSSGSMVKQCLITGNKDYLMPSVVITKPKMPQCIFHKRSDEGNKLKRRRSVAPPRYPLRLKTKRQRAPIDSFSNMLAVSTRHTPHSEYTGYVRQTVSDAWNNFAANYSAKPTPRKQA